MGATSCIFHIDNGESLTWDLKSNRFHCDCGADGTVDDLIMGLREAIFMMEEDGEVEFKMLSPHRDKPLN